MSSRRKTEIQKQAGSSRVYQRKPQVSLAGWCPGACTKEHCVLSVVLMAHNQQHCPRLTHTVALGMQDSSPLTRKITTNSFYPNVTLKTQQDVAPYLPDAISFGGGVHGDEDEVCILDGSFNVVGEEEIPSSALPDHIVQARLQGRQCNTSQLLPLQHLTNLSITNHHNKTVISPSTI
ncbi:hypothetical protein E2C01_002131 [Portunus trituberculatus]|uniref:Uncharacterized protein n=1 Tax=Portunus trituberculatus TaxID=210409 RepID=A0A5B7CIY0_PORTR|nr:hypothetical protein [Portunus trituberculatus]